MTVTVHSYAAYEAVVWGLRVYGAGALFALLTAFYFVTEPATVVVFRQWAKRRLGSWFEVLGLPLWVLFSFAVLVGGTAAWPVGLPAMFLSHRRSERKLREDRDEKHRAFAGWDEPVVRARPLPDSESESATERGDESESSSDRN